MSEKKEAPRGKPSVVRKKASPTMPSPVSAKLAAEIRDDNDDEFDDATVIASEFSGFKVPKSDASKKSPAAATVTPAPKGDYDPKTLSAKGGGTPPSSRHSDATRQTPVIVKSAAVAASTPPRTSPAIIRTGPRSGSTATVETPKIIADELSARISMPTPAPPPDEAVPAPLAAAKSQGMVVILAAVVLLVAGGIGALLLFGGDDASEERVDPPTTVTTEPQDDSVGNLIKKADEQFVAGELVGDGGALSLLVAARVASPDDDRIAIRLAPLADKFKELGDAALAAGDIVEAVAHYKNSLEADPGRREVEQKLSALTAEIKNAEDDSK